MARTPAGVPDVALQPYDNVLIMRQTGWERQRLVYLTGQVKHPGRYALTSKTERLDALLRRAGGLTPQAYPGGVQFYRNYSPGRRPAEDRPPQISAEGVATKDTLPRRITERVGIDLPRVLKNKNTPDNIILAGGDSIHVPEFNPIVMVDGSVNAPGAVSYTPGKSLDWYVSAAGGYTQLGDNKRAYVTQPNGKREAVKRRVVFADGVPKPSPGAVVYVPTKRIQDQSSNVLATVGTLVQVLATLVTTVIVARRL
jgi:protein involved in polysaccharide export with SLBB domain